MPLLPETLKSQLQAIAENHPANSGAAGVAWGNAVGAYAAGMVPASTTVAAAASVLGGALAAAFVPPDASAAMETAFTAFATAVGLGQAGFVPTPPPGQVGFAAQFAAEHPSSKSDAAQAFADRIHAWMTTGQSTLIAPPGTVVPWS